MGFKGIFGALVELMLFCDLGCAVGVRDVAVG